MLCLGIESSCDETALAVVRDGVLLDAVLASQADIHALFGGVVPELASREHYRYLGTLFDQLMQRLDLRPSDLDVVAVSRGPGLLGSLLVGVAFAKALALGCGARFLGVNHLHAHLLAAGLENELRFPALGLLVSGGHTHIYRMESPSRCIVLGKTLDDAAGEAFDKVARVIGLGYPGGPLIDRLAKEGNPHAVEFKRVYLEKDSLDFSFSGIKTGVLNYINSEKQAGREIVPADIAASFQQAVLDVIVKKTIAAAERMGEKRLVLAGGVAANSALRAQLADACREKGIQLFCPPPVLCTDNAAMIACAAYYAYQEGVQDDLTLDAYPALDL